MKLTLKENKKQLKEVWNNKDNNPNWNKEYRELKLVEENIKQELNELENGKEVRIWIECKLLGCQIWTERKIWGIPDLPFKWQKKGDLKSEFDWVKFEKVEKCESCAKLSEKEIKEIKIHNKMWDEVSDEIMDREIKNHSWAK